MRTCITQSACKFHIHVAGAALKFSTPDMHNTNWSDYGAIFKSGNMKLDKTEL